VVADVAARRANSLSIDAVSRGFRPSVYKWKIHRTPEYGLDLHRHGSNERGTSGTYWEWSVPTPLVSGLRCRQHIDQSGT
jgi:hypothetical protein